ncbi:hypothetical protein EGT36_30190 [Agrobacterium sp. FDAARGOS_525]|nr:hypothetical protein EGT36_30190 [Agrobacterium sp. FDAARGOS_525]
MPARSQHFSLIPSTFGRRENLDSISVAFQPLSHIGSIISPLVLSFTRVTDGFGDHHIGYRHLTSGLKEPIQRLDATKEG